MHALTMFRTLPRRAKRIILINTINAAGSGLVVPLLVVYLYDMRGFGYAIATGAVAATSVGALAGGPAAGWISDRFGRMHAVWASLLLSALGALGYVWSSVPEVALIAGLVQGLGVGGAITWNALIADLVPQDHWPSVFSLDFAAVNAMMGIGGLIGGFAAGSFDSLLTFQLLYAGNAAAFVITGFLASWELRKHEEQKEKIPSFAEDHGSPVSSSTYGDVLRHRGMLGLMFTVMILFTVGYSQLNSGMPAFVLDVTALGPTELGVMFAVNTAMVVASQIVILPYIKNLTPRISLMILASCWAAFWGLMLFVSGTGNLYYALALACAAMAVFAVGESLLAATGPTLVNSWASDNNRGRFNATYGFTTSVGFIAGPLLSGSLVSSGHAVPMAVSGIAVFALLAAVLFFFKLLPASPLGGLEETARSEQQTADNNS